MKKFICKNCKNYFKSLPLKYEQNPFCDKCYYIRFNKFITQNNIKPIQSFGFKKM